MTIAATTRMMMMITPTIARRWRLNRISVRRSGDSEVRSSRATGRATVSALATSSGSVPDPRIDNRVCDVREQIRGKDDDGKDEGDAHDHREIPPVGRVNDSEPKAGPGEDGLRDRGCSHHVRQVNADHAQDGDEGVAQSVAH